MNPYVIRFALAQLVCAVFVGVITEMLKLKSGTGGLAMAGLVASSYFAGLAFIKDHDRAPDPEEKAAFAKRALIVSWLLSLVMMLGLGVKNPAMRLGSLIPALLSSPLLLMVMVGVVVVMSGVYYMAIRWAFGWYTEKAAG